jgi:hypothetical protein
MNTTKPNRFLYWFLIIIFALLYLFVAGVSTLHAISFFELSNNLALAILLGLSFEAGQAAVLASLLLTEHKNRTLAWGMMFLLTALQITGNVYASFKHMDTVTGDDWRYWQRSILFFIEDESPEMYKVIISWISGALLPIIALGMTALVVDNIHLMRKAKEDNGTRYTGPWDDEDEEETTDVDVVTEKEEKLPTEEVLDKLSPEITDDSSLADLSDRKEEFEKKFKEQLDEELESYKDLIPTREDDLKQEDEPLVQDPFKSKEENPNIPEVSIKTETTKHEPSILEIDTKTNKVQPVNKKRGWHMMKEYVDDEGNVFNKGKFSHNDPKRKKKEEETDKPKESKKA